jgi:hypothetical protein
MRTTTRRMLPAEPGPVTLQVIGGPLDLVVAIDDTAIAAAAELAGPCKVVRATTTTSPRAGVWRIRIPDPERRRNLLRRLTRRPEPPPPPSRTQILMPGDEDTGPPSDGVTWLTVTVPAGSSIDTRTGRRTRPPTPSPGKGTDPNEGDS